MESMMKLPTEMSFTGNVSESWRRWKKMMSLYIDAAMAAKSDKEKWSTFLYTIGEEGREIFDTLTFEDGENEKVASLFTKFEAYCHPKKNITVERHKFFLRAQQNEGIDQYITDLKLLAKTCEFADLKDGLIKDRIVCGVKSDKLKERLLRETELTLKKATEICQANELSQSQVKSLTGQEKVFESSVHAVHKKPYRKSGGTRNPPKEDAATKTCGKCGYVHKTGVCPARGKTCAKCQRKNHFAQVCQTHAPDGESAHVSETLTRGTQPGDLLLKTTEESEPLGRADIVEQQLTQAQSPALSSLGVERRSAPVDSSSQTSLNARTFQNKAVKPDPVRRNVATSPGLPESTGFQYDRAANTPSISGQPTQTDMMRSAATDTSPGEHTSFRDAALTPGPWLIQSSRKKRSVTKNTSQGLSSNTPTKKKYLSNGLRGVKHERSDRLYLRNISMASDEDEDDILNKVKDYAADNGIRIMSGYVVSNRYVDDVVGCRISVPSSQSTDVLRHDFWPNDIECRRWRPNRLHNRSNRRDQDQNSRQERTQDDHYDYEPHNDDYGSQRYDNYDYSHNENR